MSSQLVSNIPQAKQIIHESMVNSLNAAARVHIEVSQSECPVDKGNLQESIRILDEATEQKPEATVAAGGIEINGVFVDYAEAVNDGHATSKGGYVPGTFFMEKGREAAIQQMEKEAQQVGARLEGIEAPRTF